MGGNYRDLGASPYPAKFDHDDATAGELLPNVVLDGAEETLTSSSAISVDVYSTKFNTTSGAQANTLADGKFHGQRKRLQMTVDGTADAVVTITSPFSAATDVITFADIGDVAELAWNEVGQYWRIIATYNCADGTSAPVVS